MVAHSAEVADSFISGYVSAKDSCPPVCLYLSLCLSLSRSLLPLRPAELKRTISHKIQGSQRSTGYDATTLPFAAAGHAKCKLFSAYKSGSYLLSTLSEFSRSVSSITQQCSSIQPPVSSHYLDCEGTRDKTTAGSVRLRCFASLFVSFASGWLHSALQQAVQQQQQWGTPRIAFRLQPSAGPGSFFRLSMLSWQCSRERPALASRVSEEAALGLLLYASDCSLGKHEVVVTSVHSVGCTITSRCC